MRFWVSKMIFHKYETADSFEKYIIIVLRHNFHSNYPVLIYSSNDKVLILLLLDDINLSKNRSRNKMKGMQKMNIKKFL